MRSLVNWALLGLVIDQPSYAYKLAQRFEREYRDTVKLSSASHVYTALATLKSRGLVEELEGTRSERQPKPHYRATPQGISEYHEWLVGQISEERQRGRLLVMQLGTLTRNPKAALEILARYEESCLQHAAGLHANLPEEFDAAGEVTARLVAEEARLAVGAKLAWVQYARQEFKALAAVWARQR
jgi:DNA-binding PadR family transcriptional regulator